MKRIVCLILACILCFGLCSCSNSTTTETQNSKKTICTEAEMRENVSVALYAAIMADDKWSQKANTTEIPHVIESLVQDGTNWKASGQYMLYQRYNEGAWLYDGPFSFVFDAYGNILDVKY